MTQRKIKDGGKILAEFMGVCYIHSFSWGNLIPVCKKWDCLEMKQFNETDLKKYQLLSDELDNVVTLYEIEPVFIQLIKNIKWLNSLKNENK